MTKIPKSIQILLLIGAVCFTASMVIWLRSISKQQTDLDKGSQMVSQQSYEIYKTQKADSGAITNSVSSDDVQAAIAKISTRVFDRTENILFVMDSNLRELNKKRSAGTAEIARKDFLVVANLCLDTIEKKPEIMATYKDTGGKPPFWHVADCVVKGLNTSMPTSPNSTAQAGPLPVSTSVATVSDGAHLVGSDVMPGTYRTTPSAGLTCYWERVRGFSGEGEDIIANGISDKGAIIVTVKSADKGFNTRDCGTWTKIK